MVVTIRTPTRHLVWLFCHFLVNDWFQLNKRYYCLATLLHILQMWTYKSHLPDPSALLSHIVPPVVGALSDWPRCGGVRYTTLGVQAVPRWFLFLWRATAAEDGPPNEQHGGGSPAHIQRRPDLHLLTSGDDGTVKLNYDGVCWPGNWNQLGQSCCDERPAWGDHHPGFNPFIVDAVGALCPHHRDEKSHKPQDNGGHGERPGGLQVLR